MNVPGMLDAGSKALGGRFDLVNVLPPAVPLLVGLLCWRSGAYSGQFDPRNALPSPDTVDLVQLLLLPVLILLVGVVVAPFQIALVRLLEGYWGRSALGLRLTSVGVEVQRRRMVRLQAATELPSGWAQDPRRVEIELKAAAAALQVREFPEEGLLLPTRLGNVLRAAETNAGERYGLDTVESYPRLRQVLSERLDQGLAELLTQLDAAAAFASAFFLSGILSLALAPHGGWAAVPLGFLLLSWLSYRGARVVAGHHGRLLLAAFDLHRFDLLKQLHYQLPADPEAELIFNRQLSAFWSGEAQGRGEAGMPSPYVHRFGSD